MNTAPGRARVAPFYAGWHLVNEALIAAIAPLGPEQLGLLIRAEWPVWASVSHVAGTRAFWLCHIFREPGVETTPFADLNAGGWEDDLAHPRTADELVHALTTTWRIIEHALETWTPEMLAAEARRTGGDGSVRIHTRQSVLMRCITHEAFHSGEISLVLGEHGLGAGGANGPIDMWAGLSRPAG